MKVTDEILAELSFVKTSTYREKTMMCLKDTFKFPNVIAKETGIRTNHISNILGELKEHDLVECINPEVGKGKLYRLTEKGNLVCENIDKIKF